MQYRDGRSRRMRTSARALSFSDAAAAAAVDALRCCMLASMATAATAAAMLQDNTRQVCTIATHARDVKQPLTR